MRSDLLKYSHVVARQRANAPGPDDTPGGAAVAEGTCSFEGCERSPRTRGWCQKHYLRWWKHGDPMVLIRHSGTPAERYEAKIDRSGGPDACHPWTRYCNRKGYGQFGVGEKVEAAHRFGYRLYVGPIPDGMQVLHRCDNPPCQNQRHWFLGTNADNMADRQAKGRQARGERIPNSRLTADVVREIRSRFTGQPGEQQRLAREYGISPKTVSGIKTRARWGHIE